MRTLPLPLEPAPAGWQDFEAAAQSAGFRIVAGLDEVGRGCLAGPVMAAAVVLPNGMILPGVADSKQLSAARREAVFPRILEAALAWAIGEASAEEVDAINILRATQLAMRRALEQLVPSADFLLIDGNQSLPLPVKQRTIVKGDSLCLSIASASILAKVTRDRWMIEQDSLYPGYGFVRHKGYGSPEHLRALERLGPCPLHRRSFRGVLTGGLEPPTGASPASSSSLELPFSASPSVQGHEHRRG